MVPWKKWKLKKKPINFESRKKKQATDLHRLQVLRQPSFSGQLCPDN